MSDRPPRPQRESREQAREARGPACAPCVSSPARRSPSESHPSPASGGETERRPEGGQPARWEPEGSSPDNAVGLYPRIVTPGIENQSRPHQVPEPGMWCRPDWIRMVGSESNADWLIARLSAAYGESVPHNGAMYFRAGALWHPGILMSWGHKSEIVMIDLQGSRLASTQVEEFMQLTTEIMMRGFRCTRIDLAVDHVSMDLQIYKNAVASCEAGELCKLRTFSPDPEYKADGTPTRRLLKLGKRDSAVCVRIYDKGLETQTLPAGQWERFEVEFKDDRANEVCIALIQSEERMPQTLWEYVIGSVDFREHNGRTELKRRPRVQWWDLHMSQSHPRVTKPTKKESSFTTWCSWYRTSVGPRLLQLSGILNVAPQELFEFLIQDLEPSLTEVPATKDARKQSGQIMDNLYQRFEGSC